MNELEENIRSEEIQDIMGRLPHWIIRWGITIILSILLVLILFSFIIKYPDILAGNITITTKTPPANLIAKASGRLTILVKDNDKISKDEFVAIIENPATNAHIFTLRDTLDYFQMVSNSPVVLISDSLKYFPNLNLGELQEAYNTFKRNCEEYYFLINFKQKEKFISSYKKQIKFLSDHSLVLRKKKRILEKEMKIIQRQFEVDSALYYNDKAITQLELDKSESTYIKLLNDFEEINKEEINNQQEIEKISLLINETIFINDDQKIKLETAISLAYKELESEYSIWREKYIIVAPIDGRISFYQFWNNNQFIQLGEEVANLLPDSMELVGKLLVSAERFGKVKVGQKTRISLDNYPASQYGRVTGYITSLSELNKNNVYVVTVSLPTGLNTSYKKKLEFKQNLNGRGEIITEDLNLIERWFYQFRELAQSKYKRPELETEQVEKKKVYEK